MTHRQRRLQRRAHKSVGKKVLLAVCVLFAIIGIGVASAGIWVLDVAADAPDIDSLKPAKSGESSQVFAADGTSLGYVQSTILRTQVGLGEIPDELQEATIAIEDEHFYDHSGVDYGAIVRAAIENVEAGHVKQGASTITQQLVRNLYIPDPQDTLKRKIVEAEMAMQYEDEYTKDQILKRYLNTAAYTTNDGRTAVGVEAAAQVLFSKNVSELNLEQSALLAGLPQAPSDYNPFTNPKGAKQRRNEVLTALAAQHYITFAQAQEARGKPLELQRGLKYESRSQQYFFDFVQQELIDTYGLETAREGGLKVYTTLDPQLQQLAETSIQAHPVTGAAEALVSVDAETGEIKAMASSESYEDSQFNLAAQGRRQPGSSFKPYALAAAIDQGYDPDTTYYNGSSTTLYPYGPLGDPWPVASDGSGATNLRDGLAHSVNSVFAALAIDIGPEAMDDMAKKLGVTSPLEGVPADVLGASDVTVLDQASAYATFANGGVHHDPTAIAKVEFPNGDVDEPAKAEGNRVLSPGVAYEMEDIMRGPLDYGTATCCDIPCPASGKTGTTETQADAWFVGYTPHVSTAVWVGNPNDRTPLPGYGADLAAPIWHDYMEVAAAKPCDDFPVPASMPDLSTHYSSYTTDPNADTPTDDTDTTKPDKPDDDTTTDDGTVAPDDSGSYDPDLYAPGAGQDPAPTPPTPGGDEGGDTGGAGGGNGANGGGIVHP